MDTSNTLRLRMTPEQTARLLSWARDWTAREVEADCEPSGYMLTIDVGGPGACTATARRGSSQIDLGEVDFDFEGEATS